jgi:RecB family exonuclease
VLLTSWQGARGLEVRAGWLVDLGSGTFPPATRQDPILPDTARRQITSATGCPLPLKLERSAEAELQLRLGLAVASERLTLTYVRSDPLTGRALLPAHGVLECVHQAEGRHLGYAQIDASRFVHWLGDRPPDMKAADRRPLLTAAEYDLAAALTDPTGAGAHLLLDHGWRRQLRCDRARYGDSQLTAWDGLVARTPRTGTVWVTTLEELATCPFRFFLGTVLGLIPAPDPEDEFQPDRREVGTIAHSVVESVLQSWQRADGTLPEALDPAMVSEVSEEVHAQISLREDGLGGGSRALWAAVADELARHLTEGLRRELHVIAANGWRPRAEEVAHEATITFADVALRLGGRADRVDADTSGRLVITDYKYSRGPRARVLLDGGQRLQLPFYARLMASRFGAQIEAARYAYLRADAHRPQRSLTIDELEQLAPQLAELTAELVSIAQEGTLFQYPESDRSRCEGCDYWELCGPGVRAVFRRKHTTDPRLQQHASLKSRFP